MHVTKNHEKIEFQYQDQLKSTKNQNRNFFPLFAFFGPKMKTVLLVATIAVAIFTSTPANAWSKYMCIIMYFVVFHLNTESSNLALIIELKYVL